MERRKIDMNSTSDTTSMTGAREANSTRLGELRRAHGFRSEVDSSRGRPTIPEHTAHSDLSDNADPDMPVPQIKMELQTSFPAESLGYSGPEEGQRYFTSDMIPTTVGSYSAKKGRETLGEEGRRNAAKKGNETRGEEGRRKATKKAKETLGEEGRRDISKRGRETLGEEGRSNAAKRGRETLGEEGRRNATKKARETLGEEGRRNATKKAKETLGEEGRRNATKKAKETLGEEGRRNATKKAKETL